MRESDFAAASAAATSRRDDDLVALYKSFPAIEWLRDCYDWKSDHAEEFSECIQRLCIILPTEGTSFEDFALITENYIGPMVHIPDSINLAAKAAVTFWNRNPTGDPQPLRDLLTLLESHPDGDRVKEIAATAISVE